MDLGLATGACVAAAGCLIALIALPSRAEQFQRPGMAIPPPDPSGGYGSTFLADPAGGLALAGAACGSVGAPSPATSPQPASSSPRAASASPSASASPRAPASPSAPASSPAPAGQLLQPGISQGRLVTQLQRRLAALKYYPGPVDGLRPVSHGCVRIPMDIAAFLHALVPAPGTLVYIRG